MLQRVCCFGNLTVFRALSIMDDNGDKKLTRDELKSGMADYGVELNMREVEELFNYFGKHN